MISELKKIFLDIGLNEKEAKILELLFYYKHLKALEIATKTKINRTTAYAILKNLQKKGLVTTVSIYGINEFQAINLNLFSSYIKRQKETLNKSLKKIEELAPKLDTIRSSIDSLPKVSFFQGIEGVKQAYEDTLDNNKSKKIYVFSGPDIVFKEMGSDYVDYYVKKRTKLNIKSYQIAPNTDWGQYINKEDKKYLRITKLIPAEFAFDTEMVLYDEKISIFSFSKDKLIAVIIDDKAIFNTLLSLFKYIESTI